MERIRKISAKAASGEYDKRIKLRKSDTLFEVAENFNTLSEKLELLKYNLPEIINSLEQYTKIGDNIFNIINELKDLSEEYEKSLRKDGKKINELCEDIRNKIKILQDLL